MIYIYFISKWRKSAVGQLKMIETKVYNSHISFVILYIYCFKKYRSSLHIIFEHRI